MQFNVVLRTGGLVINREIEEKEGFDGIILTPETLESARETHSSHEGRLKDLRAKVRGELKMTMRSL